MKSYYRCRIYGIYCNIPSNIKYAAPNKCIDMAIDKSGLSGWYNLGVVISHSFNSLLIIVGM